MKVKNFKLLYPQALQLFAIAIGASLCLAPLAEAVSFNGSKDNIQAPTSLSNSQSIEIAQAAVCPQNSGGSLFVAAETRNFLVYICGGDLPNTYVGVAKNGTTGSISLPLQSYTRDRFVAVNRNTRYTLTRNELIVSQNGRVVRREPATWRR